MGNYYYKKAKSHHPKRWIRIAGIGIFCVGIAIVLYVFAPLVSWQVYFSSTFAQQNIAIPIPRTTMVTPQTIASLLAASAKNLTVDYNNAANWFPGYVGQKITSSISSYTITIPKIHVTDAVVSTVDNDLSQHMVNFTGTSIPPDKGNPVIFGHSTLPELFDPHNYHTILANAYKLQNGDDILVTVANVTYRYKIFSITVVNPDDTSVFQQNYDDSYFTLVTCTPPGTIWYRLVVRARLQKM